MTARPAAGVIIVGAGPYGLAAAAHLRARGITAHVLGEEMAFWRRQMPLGMRLRSSWEASSISDPDDTLTLDSFEAAEGRRLERPIPLEDFIRYALWFQRHVVPDLDRRRVERVERDDGRFRLRLEDGELLSAPRVVIATGLEAFARRPAQLRGLEAPLVRHASELRDLTEFSGRRTAVIGAGQSGIELAALLDEAGAEVEVIARAGRVRWLNRSGWLHERSGGLRRLLYPPTDVGPIGLSWLVAAPDLFRRVPPRLGDRIAYRCIRPAAASWLVPRTTRVRMTLGRVLTAAAPSGEQLRLTLDDGATRTVDRLVLATGYEVALPQDLLAPELRSAVLTRDGAPVLGAGLESSVPGLHFLGAFAAPSFGPVMRFVSGTRFAAPALAAKVAGTPAHAVPPAEPAPALT
jgi:lysine/ornithine N-monooxygenase